ncbi:MAG TPA: hypothetical protein DEB60_03385 [Brevundimonas sp.]|nr:hypothetical protein [Brevundimonas sp.]
MWEKVSGDSLTDEGEAPSLPDHPRGLMSQAPSSDPLRGPPSPTRGEGRRYSIADHPSSTSQSLKNVGFAAARQALTRPTFGAGHHRLPARAAKEISDDFRRIGLFFRQPRQAANRPPFLA